MNENLKSKITNRLDALTDEGGRQLLDYLEFLLSKYNKNVRQPSTMQRIAEGLEDRLDPSQIADAATRGAAQVIDAVDRMMSGISAATKTMTQEGGSPSESENSKPSASTTEEEESSSQDA